MDPTTIKSHPFVEYNPTCYIARDDISIVFREHGLLFIITKHADAKILVPEDYETRFLSALNLI